MRNDDLSPNNGQLTANDDYDVIKAGGGVTATGNTITGRGTVSGAAGADDAGAGHAHVTAISGVGGGSGMSAAGRYGSIRIDEQGNYTYTRNAGSPENVEDVFNYTLADKAGTIDAARLIIRIEGKEAKAEVQANAQRIVAGNEVITLPAGVELSDIHVVGRDLVIDLPDGTQMVIVDGAVFVPQLALGDVELPSDTLASLLIDSEPRPAAGPPESSGGNFEEPVAPLDPGVPLGDLLPPTELDYTPPEFEDVYVPEEEDEDLAPQNAAPITLEVDDDALPTGRNSSSPDEVDSDSLVFTAGTDALTGFEFSTDLSSLGGGLTWTRVSDTLIEGRDGGVLIVSLSLSAPGSIAGGASGSVTVTATLADNYDSHPGINLDDLVNLGSVVVIASEDDGTTATGVVNVGVSDDTPSADDAAASSGIVIDETSFDAEGWPISATSGDPMISGAAVFGADGPAASGSLVFGISLNGGGSTLATTIRTAVGDQLITLNQTNATTITGTYGAGSVAFTIVMGADGKVTYTQFVPLEHSDDGNTAIDYNDTNSPITFSGLINATVTVKDGDGDTDTASVAIGDRIEIFDDGPNAGVNLRSQVGEAILDETRPEGSDTPGATGPSGLASTTIGFADNFLTPDFGADGAGPVSGGVAYSLILSGADIPSGLYALQAGDTTDGDGDGYGQGAEIVLNQDGNTITGSVGDVDYFTISIDPATGIVTFTQLQPIWHSEPGEFDELAYLHTEAADDIVVRQTVTDADGDFDTADINIGQDVFGIEDDGPDAYDPCPVPVVSINDPDVAPTTGDLNLPNVGEDQPGVLTFAVMDGDAVLDNDGNPISSGGEPLYYFINEDGALEARAGGEEGDAIFVITLNGDGTYTFDQIGDISAESELSITDLSSVGGGNVDAKAIDVPDSPYDLMLTTKSGTTVNTNATEIGIGSGNSFSAGEVLRVDLVQNVFVTGSGPSSVLNFGEYYTANSYRQDVSGLGGSQTASFTVRAVVAVESGVVGPVDGDNIFYGDGNDTFVTGTTLNLYDDAGNLVDPADYASLGITVTALADGWQVEGLPNDYDFQIVSGTAFNAVQIEAIEGTDTFKLGFIDLTTTIQSDVDFMVPLQLTDADGDPVLCDIDIHLGAPTNVPGVNATVNEAGLPVIGSDAASNSEITSGELSAIVNGGTGPYTYAIVGSGDGTYGTLTIDPATGHYQYVLDTPFDTQPDANNGTNVESGRDVFTYQVTDANGIVTTATITINIVDDVPTADFTINEGAQLVIDETDNFAANPSETDAPGGDLGSATVSAAYLFTNASIYGADGENATDGTVYGLRLSSGASAGSSLATTLITSDGDHAITLYVMPDGSVVGSTAASYGDVDTANIVFSVSITADGQVTMTQFQAIEHSDSPDNYNESSTVGSIPVDGLLVELTVTDGDGDQDSSTADLGSIIRFLDDGPSIEVKYAGLPEDQQALDAVLLVTQDDGTEGSGDTSDSTSANFAGLFSLDKDGGSDGEKSSSLVFKLDVIGDAGSGGVDSGLDSHGATIYLYQMDDLTVYGSTSATKPLSLDGSVVFSLTTTSGGVVTLTQYQQIDHSAASDPDGTGSPFADHVVSLGDDLIQLIATGSITDNDNDVASDTFNLDMGGLVQFQDDGPSIDISLKEGAALHIDESVPGTDGPGETDAVGLGQVTVAISTLVSVDDTPVSADSPTDTDYELTLGTPNVGGLVDSGLKTSDGSQTIYLFKDGNTIYGSTSTVANGSGVDSTNTVFQISIIGGNVVMTQYQAIENPTAGGPGAAHDENSASLAGGALLLTATQTDYDGDTATDSVDLGSIVTFGDDGPVVTNTTLAGTQPENANVVVDVTGNIDAGSDGFDRVDDYSTDGAGSLSYDPITQQFTYIPASGESGTVHISYRVYDNDGDWDDATITFELADSAPVAIDVTAKIDDDGLATGNALSTAGDIDANDGETGSGTSSEKIWTGQLGVSSGGADTPLTYSLAGMHNVSGVVGAENVNYTWDGTTNTLTATTTSGSRIGTVLFTVQITDVDDGNYTITLQNAIRHVTQAAPGDETSAAVVNLTYTVSDSDTPADSDDGLISITFNDDAPTADLALKAGAQLVIDETDGVTANASETDPVGGNLGVAVMSAANLYVNSSVYGADGAAASGSAVYSLLLNGSSVEGTKVTTTLQTSAGDLPIYLYMKADGSVVASTSSTYVGVATGNTVFTVSIAADGTTTMTQFQAIEHNDSPNNYDENTTAGSIPTDALQVKLTVKDGDNDTNSDVVDLGSIIRFEDDGPAAHLALKAGVQLVIDETDGVTANAFETDPVGGNLGVAVMSAANLYVNTSVYGSDGAAASGSAVYSLQLNGSTVEGTKVTTTLQTSNGDQTIYLYMKADGSVVGSTSSTYVGVATGNTVFTVSIAADGTTTMTQFQAIEHNDAPNNYDENTTAGSIPPLALEVVLTVKDGDNDTSRDVVDLGSIIRFEDDGPTAHISLTGVGVVHDETAGLQNDADDVAAFSFTVGSPTGIDTDGSTPLGYARGSTAVSSAGSVYGSDSSGSIEVKLSVAPGGVDSGLTITEGTKIWLFEESGVIVGRIGTTALLAQNGPAAFAIRLDGSNHLEMVQFLSVTNPTGGTSHDEPAYIAGNLIKVTVTVTDSDGDKNSDFAFIGTNSIGFQDDGPVVDDRTVPGIQPENSAVVIPVSADIHAGVDGFDHIEIVSKTGAGTLTYNAGSFTYTPANGEQGVQSFVYRVYDKDGDYDDATVTFTLAPDSVPVAGTANATVDDEGLGGIAGLVANGDIDANAGDLDATSEAIFKGTLGGTSVDPISAFKFVASLTGTTQVMGQETVTYTVSGDGLTITAKITASPDASRINTDLFKVEITSASGAYTVTLLDNVLHPAGSLENDVDISIAYQVYDNDNDPSALPGSLNIKFDDDMPNPYSTPPVATTINNGAGTSGALALNVPLAGADGGTLHFTTVNGTPVTKTGGGALTDAQGNALYYTINANDPTILEARTSATPGQGDLVFQIDLQGSTYVYTQFEQVATSVYQPVSNLSSVGGGNVEFKAINVPNSAFDLILTTKPGFTVNTSADFMGIGGGQSFSASDALRLDFVTVTTSGNGGNQVATAGEYYGAAAFRQDVGGMNSQQFASFTVKAIVAVETPGTQLSDPADGNNVYYGDTNDTVLTTGMSLNIYDAAGNLVTPANYALYGITVSQSAGVFTVNHLPNNFDYEIVSAGTTFNAVQVEGIAGSSTFKLGALAISAFGVQPASFQVPVELTDGDGDSVSSTITINLTVPAPPVILDTNHDGFAFLGLDAGVLYDMDNDGDLDATAWVGSGDSILFRDADGNGTVSNSTEFVFGAAGQTDLEALHAMYGDQLDASDADFLSFGLWNDANSNGVVDGGEITMMTDSGIISIDLVSNGDASVTADGSVAVGGYAGYTDADGEHEGGVADASFAYAEANDEQRFAGAANTANVVAAAMAAAGLASQAAAHADSHADFGLDTASAHASAAPMPSNDDIDFRVGGMAKFGDSEGLRASDDLPAATGRHSAVVEEARGLVDADHGADMAPPAGLIEATDTPTSQALPAIDVAPAVVMAEAASVDTGRHNAVVTEQLIEKGDSAVDAILAKLGGDSAIEALADVHGAAKAVQGWDMGGHAHLPIAAMELIGAEASLLHPDAVQPVVHG